MKEELQKVKKEHPTLDHKEAFKKAAGNVSSWTSHETRLTEPLLTSYSPFPCSQTVEILAQEPRQQEVS